MKKPHVGIVGAEISDVRCADKLISKEFRVTILEARNMIGGRICQSEDLGYTVDIGPNWIHAWTDSDVPHPIYKLAADPQTPLHHWNTKQLLFDEHGGKLPNELTERLSTTLWDIIEEAFKFSKAAHAKDGDNVIPTARSLQDFIRERAQEVLSDDHGRGLLVKMSEIFGAYVGEPVWKQSLRFAWMEECCGGEEMFVASNYSSILALAAKPALTHADIRLKTRVVKVVSSISEEDKWGAVSITTSDGDVLSFDEVVITAPLGFLKQHHADMFVPELPPRLVAARSNISLSQLEKVFITFPTAFWKNHLKDGEEFPSYTNWLSPLYSTSTNLSSWPQEIWDLSSFTAPNNHPTILLYIYGDYSRHIVNPVHGWTA